MATSLFFSRTSIVSSSSLNNRNKPTASPNFFFFFNPSNVSAPDVSPLRLFSSRRITTHQEAVLSSKTWAFRQTICSCMKSDKSEFPESQPNSSDFTEATIDLQLPRRSLSVQFTCNSCGERTKRLVNRLAYERGTVFVQCAWCLKHHKLVDNLGLVVEYDFRKDEDTDVNADKD